MNDQVVTIKVEGDREAMAPKGFCDNCGDELPNSPLLLFNIVPEEMVGVDAEYCSWGCLLEFCAVLVATVGRENDIRPLVTINDL